MCTHGHPHISSHRPLKTSSHPAVHIHVSPILTCCIVENPRKWCPVFHYFSSTATIRRKKGVPRHVLESEGRMYQRSQGPNTHTQTHFSKSEQCMFGYRTGQTGDVAHKVLPNDGHREKRCATIGGLGFRRRCHRSAALGARLPSQVWANR